MTWNYADFVGIHDFDVRHMTLLWTEFLGTFFIVFTSGLTMAQKCIEQDDLMKEAEGAPPGASMEQISLGFGLVFAAVAQAFGSRSACHFNPAVTIGSFVVGDLSLLMSILFIIMQCIGSVAGVFAAKSLLPKNLDGIYLGVPMHPDVSVMGLAIIEMFLTFMWVFLARSAESFTSDSLRDTAPLAVGATIIAGYLAAYRLTGGIMNPARCFGTSLVYMNWEDHWIYWSAAIIGGIFAALTQDFVFKEKSSDETGDQEDV